MTTYIAMNPTKRKKLTAAGWKVGSAADFLELTPEDTSIGSYQESHQKIIDVYTHLKCLFAHYFYFHFCMSQNNLLFSQKLLATN